MQLSKSLRRWLSPTFGLAILVLMGWGVVLILQILWAAFAGLNPTVAAAILAAVTTILVSVVSVLVSKYLEQRNAVRKELREKKAPVYEALIELIFRVIFSDKMGQAPLTEAELVTRFSTVNRQLVVWGSDEVVAALYKFRQIAALDVKSPALLVLTVEEMFLAIRRDLGHSNKGLTAGKVMGTFINDLHKLAEP